MELSQKNNYSSKCNQITKNFQSLFIKLQQIKTTDLKLLNATPCRGFIQVNMTITIDVTCNEPHKIFQAKLLVISAGVSSITDSFENAWNKLSQKSIENSYVNLIKN